MVHEDFIILDANQAFAELLGYPEPDALAGKHALEVTPLTPESRQRIEAHSRAGSAETYRVELATSDGSLLTIETCGKWTTYRGRKARLVSMRDITERRRAEVERETLEAQLRQAQKMESVGRLAGGVAHDLNNLLMGIMNYVELCRDELSPQHPIRGYLDEITRDAQRSADITKQLLGFARKQPIAPQVLDLNDALAGMLKMLRHMMGEDIGLTQGPGAEPVAATPARLSRGTETILLAEDENSVRVTSQLFLETLGYTVLAAETPEEALRLAGTHCGPIHLLIADVIMPGMNGPDLARVLTDEYPNLKCLFISGYTADVMLHRGTLGAGMPFLSKPISRDDLARKARRVLDGES